MVVNDPKIPRWIRALFLCTMFLIVCGEALEIFVNNGGMSSQVIASAAADGLSDDYVLVLVAFYLGAVAATGRFTVLQAWKFPRKY
jgi:hypothetical protein